MSQVESPEAATGWQLWLDGAIRRTPLPLADGVLVVLDRAEGSAAVRLGDDGRVLWQLELPGTASADPQRTHDFAAVPIDGERVIVIDIKHGRQHGPSVGVPGATLHGCITALGGRLWLRFSESDDGMGPLLAVCDLATPDAGPYIHPDPLGDAIETRCRRTNKTIVAAAEHPDGHATLVGLDERKVKVLWKHELADTGVVDLWAAGGLVDLVTSDSLQSWDARTGHPLTRRFEGRVLEGARLAGETLLIPVYNPVHGRRLQAYNAATETELGDLPDIARVLGANSDHALLRTSEGAPLLVELPELTRVAIRDTEAVDAAELVSFSRHALWIVGHGGRSLTCVEPG